MLRRWVRRVRWTLVRWLIYRHTLRATQGWYAVTWAPDLDAMADRIAEYLHSYRVQQRDHLYGALLALWLPVPVATWLARRWPVRWLR